MATQPHGHPPENTPAVPHTTHHRPRTERHVTHRRYPTTALAAAAAAVVLAGCNNTDDTATGTENTTTPTPVVTAPPTMTEEDQLADDIENTYRDSIARLDEAYGQTTDWVGMDYSDDIAAVMSDAQLGDQAQLDVHNDLTAHVVMEMNRTGPTVVETVEVVNAEAGDEGTASLTACVDLSAIEYTDNDGETVEPADVLAAMEDNQEAAPFLEGFVNLDDVQAQMRTVELRMGDDQWLIASQTTEGRDSC